MHPFFTHLGRSIADCVLPAWCLHCQAPGAWFCVACRQQSPLLPLGWCGRCGRRAPTGTTLCRRCAESLRLTTLVSAFGYHGPVERVIRTIKYRPAEVGITALVAGAARTRLAAAVPDQSVLVPIPLHPDRLTRRGFNQAEQLARQLTSGARPGRLSRSLERTKSRPPQVGLARAERLSNLRGAFVWHGPSLSGQTVCLVDDVVTTGATLAEAAGVLRAAGARRVVAVTLAMTPPDRTTHTK